MKSPDQSVSPYIFEDRLRHDAAMREAVETLVFTADDGQRFSGLHLNRDFSDQPPILSINAMFTGCNSLGQKYAAYQYAAANPSRSVLRIDMPAHGYSDGMSDAQYKEITTQHGLTRIGRSQAEAIRRRLPDIEELVVEGESLGGREGFEFVQAASTIGFQTLKMFGFDPVGLEDRSTLAVNTSYFLKEWRKSRQLYYDNESNQSLNDAYERTFKKELHKYGFTDDFSMAAVFKRDPRILRFLVAGSPLALATGSESLGKMLESQPGLMAYIVVGGLSTICRWRKIEPAAERLQVQFPGRLAFEVWPNDSHGMSLPSQQPRLAAHVKTELEKED